GSAHGLAGCARCARRCGERRRRPQRAWVLAEQGRRAGRHCLRGCRRRHRTRGAACDARSRRCLLLPARDLLDENRHGTVNWAPTVGPRLDEAHATCPPLRPRKRRRFEPLRPGTPLALARRLEKPFMRRYAAALFLLASIAAWGPAEIDDAAMTSDAP